MKHLTSTASIQQNFQECIATVQTTLEALAAPLAAAVDTITSALANNGKVLMCGNGGSAADAQHFAAELIGRFERERPSLAAIALCADTSTLTAIGNDYGFAQLFARQIRGLGQPGDILLALSTSGNSENILAAIDQAHERNMGVIALTGKGGGRIRDALLDTDLHLCVPSTRTARIQEVHALLIHCLCDGIDAMLLGESL